MTEPRSATSFVYDHCDIPDGESLQSWKRRQRPPHRRAQVTGGLAAAFATLAPILLTMRGARR